MTKLILRRSPYLLVPGAPFFSLCERASSATAQGCLKMLFRSEQVDALMETGSGTRQCAGSGVGSWFGQIQI